MQVARFAAAGVSIAHCPSSNLKLASGIAPVARFIEAGITVALGSDSAASNNRLDIFTEMRTAALLAKAQSGDASMVKASHALRMATMGGACALGLEHCIGSIETGKLADLACIDLGAPGTQPVYDVVSQLVYAARSDQVSDVWVGGRHQLDSGRFTQIDLADLVSRANEWRDRMETNE
jgi:5-methylthioadenosine/S-adenosylhomocysteine deaminase